MQEGKLPHFSYLKETGSYRRLATTIPSQSPVAWAAFATGQNPGKNGVFDFIVRDPKTYKLSLSLSDIGAGGPKRVIKSNCFWQYTSRKKIPTIVIACPVTFPPDKIYGRMLSGMGVPDILGTQGTFTFYTTEALPKDKDIGGKVFQIAQNPAMILHLIGPNAGGTTGKADNIKVPFKAEIQTDGKSAAIELQGRHFLLEQGKWSDWQKVTFKISPFKSISGIFKFYLVESSPGFKLYISPINFDPRNPYFAISYPKDYSRELTKKIGLYYTQGMPMDTWAVNEDRMTEKPFLESTEEIFKEKKAMLEFELSRFKKGVLFCYFENPDIIQHMFWRYRDPAHPLYTKDAPQEYKTIIEQCYKKMDHLLEEVLGSIDKNTPIIVLSDHGFNTFRRATHVNTWLRKQGYLHLYDDNAPSGEGLLADINWSKTQAYAIGFGAIYINQKGREAKGIVEPGIDTELLKERIAQNLKGWIDEKYNAAVVNNVYDGEKIFHGKYANRTPDLYIGFNIGYRASWETAVGGVPASLIEDNLKKWSGDHLFDPALIPGIIFSNRKILKDHPSIYDLTPTILSLAGFGKEMKKFDLDGESLLCL